MKRLLRWILGLTAVAVVALLALVLGRDWILKKVAVQSVADRTGLRAEIGSVDSGLRSPFLRVRNTRLFNQPEFGGGLLLDAPEFYARFDAAQAAAGRLHFHELRLNLAELTVISDAQGRLNLDHLEKEFRRRDQERRRKHVRKTNDLEFAGIDRLEVTLGAINYVDHQHPKWSRTVKLGLTNEVATALHTENDLLEWIGATIFRVLAQQAVAVANREGRHGRYELQFDAQTSAPAAALAP